MSNLVILPQAVSALATLFEIYPIIQHNSTTIGETTQDLPLTPSGIDPEVLSKINALFSEPQLTMQPQRPAVARRDTVRTPKAWWKLETAVPSEHVLTALPRLYWNDYSDEDLDEEESTEKDSLLQAGYAPVIADKLLLPPQVNNVHTPKFLAHYIYPFEHHPDAPPPLLPKRPNPEHWPTLASLINKLIEHLIGLFIDDQHTVIEHSKEEVKRKIYEVQVQAQSQTISSAL